MRQHWERMDKDAGTTVSKEEWVEFFEERRKEFEGREGTEAEQRQAFTEHVTDVAWLADLDPDDYMSDQEKAAWAAVLRKEAKQHERDEKARAKQEKIAKGKADKAAKAAAQKEREAKREAAK
jgi:hypothetical protein